MSLVNIIIIILGSILTIALLLILKNWKSKYPAYVVVFITSALFFGWASHVLVLGRFLDFPERFFPKYTLDILPYDLIIWPGFTLFCVAVGSKNRRRFWIFSIVYSISIALQDYFAARYTTMVIMYNWTAFNTFIGCFLLYFLWSFYYNFLDKKLCNK